MWVSYNPNPVGRHNVEDCSVRALSKALNVDWEEAHIMQDIAAIQMGDMAHGDSVWGAVLRKNGFWREVIPNTCPDCYTVEDFCKDHPKGTFVVRVNDHVLTVVDGDIYDSWDSSKEIPSYYWYKKEDE